MRVQGRVASMPMLYFDICGVVLLLILIFSVISRKMIKGTQGRAFMLMLMVVLSAGLFDMWAVYGDCRPDPASYGMAGRYISHTGYLFLHNLTSLCFFAFLVSLTDTWHKITKARIVFILTLVPHMIIIVLLAINPAVNMMFEFDETGSYVRGRFFPILYVAAFTFMIASVVYIIRYRNLFTRIQFTSLMLIVPMQLLAAVVQMLNRETRVEIFFNAICLLLITVTVQRPEEYVDSFTGMRKYTAYTTDMKKNFYNDKHVSVILLNIANYTTLFGIVGYDASNNILQKVANELSAINKEIKAYADIYYLDRGRFRFVVKESNHSKIVEAAEKINSRLKQSMIINKMELNLLAYVCIARCPQDISDFKSLMAFGNDFHLTNPYSGRVLYVSELAEKNRFRLSSELDGIIDSAIANRKFEVYYQPIYSVEEKRFVSAEALLRLNDEKYGFIPPDLFISAAEKSGAIHKIGDYVLEEVCRFIAGTEFSKLGLDYIEINLSVAQCMQTDLADKVLQIIQRFRVSPDRINLEITETAANYAQNIMTANIEKLIQAGFSFSLDDYGTGYSNIKSVASLPLKIVKLDKSFVNEEENPRMWIVLQNTIKMLKDMDMHIVVEGVETEQLVKRFSDLNCEYIQGYYFSKPIPESEFIRFMYNSTTSAR